MRAADNMDELVVKRGLGVPIAAAIGSVILVASTALAVQNLLNHVAIIGSLLWLALIAFALMFKVRESGFAAFCQGTLGSFSARQLLRVDERSVDGKTVNVGFRLFGFRGVEHQIDAKDLVMITWNSGQARDMAASDVDDWSVFLWYRHGDPKREAKQKKSRHMRPEQTVIVFGRPRPKPVTEALGSQIARFLIDSGVSVNARPGTHSTA